ncbi:Zona pellucida-like domain containing protein 7 [Sarcoptes scabiei]|uniref:Zona pellucida-like domain containing protein 7 n=1 Tax=Sarcoptes scabiei TaxID=52283 RepID=A0A131ZWZ0_SARSC|nr:Zona pellucida-like domain containing protein 7 [Sarcoptes scabiei]
MNVICQNEYYEDLDNGLSSNNNNNGNNEEMIIHSPITTKLDSLDVICGKEYMTVRAEFNGQFNGIIFSKGTYGQNKCVYVKPHSGVTHATFNVRYDECGTKPDLQGKYFENTIVIQYGTDIIEAYDEAKRLRCEWFEAYEKPATFRPAIPVADLDIIEMNFQGDEIDCWMSIQEGKGPWSNEINRIVTVGQPLTIVVAIDDKRNQFDMKVKSCFAHDGIKAPIYLIDEDGCILRPKMISPFRKLKNLKGKASLISYAQFLAFKFPDSVDVQIQCTVEVCRHGCLDTCNDPSSNLLDHQSQHPRTQSYNQKPINFKRENVSAHFLLNKESDLLESANTHREPIAKPPPPSLIDDKQSISTDLDPIVSAIQDEKQNYLEMIANYLQNFDSGPKPNDELAAMASEDQKIIDARPIVASKPSVIVDDGQDHYHNPPESLHQLKKPNVEARDHQNQHLIEEKLTKGNKNPQEIPYHPHDRPNQHRFHSQQQHQSSGSFQHPNVYNGPLLSPNKILNEPIAQVMNIPLNPIYTAPISLNLGQTFSQPQSSNNKQSNGLGSLLNPFNSFKLFQKKPNYQLPQLFSNYFQSKRQYIPNDNFDLINFSNKPIKSNVFRTKRFISEQQGEIGLKKGFQVVTALDLQFLPNITQELMPIFEGKPESIVYGICFSSAYFLYAIVVSNYL